MEKISVVILAKNNAATIEKTLFSAQFFDEVIVVDTGSIDTTKQIAKKFSNVRLIEKELEGFGKLRNNIAQKAKNDWILSLDSDEEVSSDLLEEIMTLPLDKTTVYSIPFHNFYQGKWIKGCGWYPDPHLRLYNRKVTAFSNDHVHEKVQTKGMRIKKLKNPIHHNSYGSTSDFLIKMHRYSDLFVKQNAHKKSSLFKAIRHGSWAFFKSYFLKRGFLDGKEGYMISAYNGQTAYYKYLKLTEKNVIDSTLSQNR